jgi:predicted transcriptional regulator
MTLVGKALYIESVEEAASIAGGYAELAAKLGVSRDEVESWSAGRTIPECAVFLRLIDVLLNPAPDEASRRVA